MSSKFLAEFLHFAHAVVEAERALAVQTDLEPQEWINIEENTLQDQAFRELAYKALRAALEQNEPVIESNLLTLEEPPKTNVNIPSIRILMAVPVSPFGAIYLDRRVAKGVFHREVSKRIGEFASWVIQNQQTDADRAQLHRLYERWEA